MPFDHNDIRVYIDNLFVEGKFTPVNKPEINIEPGSWIQCGVAEASAEYNDLRINRLLKLVEKEIPSTEVGYSDWLAFAIKWAELGALVNSDFQVAEREQFQRISSSLNNTFAKWLSDHYASLITLPAKKPTMLHHVTRMLAQEIQYKSGTRVALIVVDDLSRPVGHNPSNPA